MEISITSKKNGKKAGFIKSTKLDNHLTMSITYQNKPVFFKDLQKLLLKHYNLKLISGEGKVGSSIILEEVLDTYKSKKYGNSYMRRERKRR